MNSVLRQHPKINITASTCTLRFRLALVIIPHSHCVVDILRGRERNNPAIVTQVVVAKTVVGDGGEEYSLQKSGAFGACLTFCGGGVIAPTPQKPDPPGGAGGG